MKLPSAPAASLCLVLLSGCVSVSQTSPQALVQSPVSFDHAIGAMEQSRKHDDDWAASFGVPELETLIAQAEANNLDLAAGLANVRRAEASLQSARSGLTPSVSGGVSSSASSEDDFASISSTRRLTASYTVDLFGQTRFSILAAEESLVSQQLTQRALDLTVRTNVASAYLTWASLTDQYDTAQKNLEISKRIHELVEARYEAGAVSGFDLESQTASLASARARIPALDQQLVSARTAIALLLGEPPQGFEPANVSPADWTITVIDAGLPSDLLSQRPDLLAAEADLRAAEANIAVARAAFYPTIDLSVGVSSLIESGADLVGSAASSLTALIFTGGRLSAQTESAKAQRDALVANYKQAVYSAFRDVDVALSAVQTSRLREEQLSVAEAAAERALALAETRYSSGADSLNSLLDAQSTYFSARDSRLQARTDRLQAAIDLYAALGGAW